MLHLHFSVGKDSDAPTLATKKSALPTRLFQLGWQTGSRFAPLSSSGVVQYQPSNLRRKKIRGIWDRACDSEALLRSPLALPKASADRNHRENLIQSDTSPLTSTQAIAENK
jgi:hypothetical protein